MMNTTCKHLLFWTKLSIATLALIILGLPISAQAQNDDPPPLEGFPYEWKSIDVGDYYTAAKLKFDAANNPLGLFKSADGDTSSASDAAARQELVDLNERGVPSIVRYIDEGDPNGDPIIFFHGLPDYAYLWRDIIPHMPADARIIAFDQLGQGFSSKHDTVTYTFKQVLAHAEAFIDALDLGDKKITLVGHDSGGPYAHAFAARHPEQIKGLIFFETAYAPLPSLEAFPPAAAFFRGAGNAQIITDNILFQRMIISGTETIAPQFSPFRSQPLTAGEIAAYSLPYQTTAGRRAAAQFFREAPIVGGAPDGTGDTNLELWSQMATYLATSAVPKLYFHVAPGVANPQPVVDFVKANFNAGNSLTTVDLGEGFHFLQEDFADVMGPKMAEWLDSLTPQEPVLINDHLKITKISVSYDRRPQPNAPAGVFTINTRFKNVSDLTLTEMLFVVKKLTGGNLLLNADDGDGGAGSILHVTDPTMLAPRERMTIDFQIGLVRRAPFTLFVDAYGFVADGALAATRADSLTDIEFHVGQADFVAAQQARLYMPLLVR